MCGRASGRDDEWRASGRDDEWRASGRDVPKTARIVP